MLFRSAVLLHELGAYQPQLLERPRIVVGSRSDIEGGVGPRFEDFTDLRISSVTGEGIDQLVYRLADLVEQARRAEPERDGFVVHRPVPEGFRIERDDGGAFRVVGRQAERAVALSDLTNAEAADYARQRLKRLGVEKALARAGVRDGDTVRIGGFEFEYFEEIGRAHV